MIAISRAVGAEDFEIAAQFNKLSGEWDAVEARAYGVPPELVLSLFHSDDGGSLATRFSGAAGQLFIARWNGVPAGSLGFETLDDTTLELQKFYVDQDFRGNGIGKALVQTVLGEAKRGDHTKIVLHSTVYMKTALTIYESFGFIACAQFREIPDAIKHTEVFMARAL